MSLPTGAICLSAVWRVVACAACDPGPLHQGHRSKDVGADHGHRGAWFTLLSSAELLVQRTRADQAVCVCVVGGVCAVFHLGRFPCWAGEGEGPARDDPKLPLPCVWGGEALRGGATHSSSRPGHSHPPTLVAGHLPQTSLKPVHAGWSAHTCTPTHVAPPGARQLAARPCARAHAPRSLTRTSGLCPCQLTLPGCWWRAAHRPRRLL